MKLTIFGATGRTGRLLVEQALATGYTVTAFVRNAGKLDIKNDRLHVFQGDIENARCISLAVARADAVISVLGPTHSRPTYDVSLSTARIIDAMHEKRVNRLIVSTGASVEDGQDQPTLWHRVITFLLKLTAGNVYRDMKRTVAAVRASDLDWTVVRVPMLTDQPATGNVRVGYVGRGTGTRLSRGDMAAFILKQIDDAAHLYQAPVVSN